MNNTVFKKLKCFYVIKTRLAMTLAEVLITLLVIGIVASITVPTLINSYQDAVFAHQYKEMFAILSGANRMAITDGVPILNAAGNFSFNFVNNYLKATKHCRESASNKCWTQSTVNGLNGVVMSTKDGMFSNIKGGDSYFLANGAILSESTNGQSNGVYTAIRMFVDLNGLAKPNTFGKDIHVFIFEILLGGGNEPVLRPTYNYNSWEVEMKYDPAIVDNGCLGLNVAGANNYGYTCGAKWSTGNQ